MVSHNLAEIQRYQKAINLAQNNVNTVIRITDFLEKVENH